jgi:SMC interacting uncharacterized protein involved in chromosome segregation
MSPETLNLIFNGGTFLSLAIAVMTAVVHVRRINLDRHIADNNNYAQRMSGLEAENRLLRTELQSLREHHMACQGQIIELKELVIGLRDQLRQHGISAYEALPADIRHQAPATEEAMKKLNVIE